MLIKVRMYVHMYVCMLLLLLFQFQFSYLPLFRRRVFLFVCFKRQLTNERIAVGTRGPIIYSDSEDMPRLCSIMLTTIYRL